MAATTMTFLEAFMLKEPDQVVEVNIYDLRAQTLFAARFFRTSTSLELTISWQQKVGHN